MTDALIEAGKTLLRRFERCAKAHGNGDDVIADSTAEFRAALAAARLVGTDAQVEAVAKALCDNWPKDPNGCAALCMDRLGSIPKEGCRHRIAVHGKRARAALAAAQAGAHVWPEEYAATWNEGFAAGIEAAATLQDGYAIACGATTVEGRGHMHRASRIRALRPAETAERPCPVCGGSGFSGHGTGYGDVCSECGGQRYLPPPSASEPAGALASQIRWQRVNDEPFEYAIQQGPHGDKFVKLIDGTCLRRSEPAGPNEEDVARWKAALETLANQADNNWTKGLAQTALRRG